MKNIKNKMIGTALTSILAFSPAYATESTLDLRNKTKTVNLVRDDKVKCEASYNSDKDVGYRVLELSCDDGYKISNPNGDNKVDEVCLSNEKCYDRDESLNSKNVSPMLKRSLENLFNATNQRIKPNGDIYNAVMAKDIEKNLYEAFPTKRAGSEQDKKELNEAVKKMGQW